MTKAIDAAIEKLQATTTSEKEQKLLSEVEQLKKQNQELEERLRKLEAASAPK